MAGLIHRVLSSVAAVAVALALSGVPQALGPPERTGVHRCHCPAGRHEGDCPLCHAQAAAAVDDAKLPPCHREAARQAKARLRESEHRRASSPRLVSTCGSEDGRLRPPPASERFTVPAGRVIAVCTFTTEIRATVEAPRAVPSVPETPPPRRAGFPTARAA